MSTAQFTTPLIVVIPGQLIAASLWNNEFINFFTNLNAEGIGAYSDNDTEMRANTDPFPSGATSRPTAISGELERIRFQFVEIVGGTYWYSRPATTISDLDTRASALAARFPVQTVDIGDLQVTDPKINDVASSKITGIITPSDGTVTTLKVVDANITDPKIVSMSASKLTGQITTPQVTDANITAIKLASDVPAAVGLKSIQTKTINMTATSVNTTANTDTTISSVNTAKAVPIVISLSVPGGSVNSTNPKFQVSLTGATTLNTKVSQDTAITGANTITYQMIVVVIEFN